MRERVTVREEDEGKSETSSCSGARVGIGKSESNRVSCGG